MINGKAVIHDNLYDECVVREIPTHNHYSDLYIPVTEETAEIIRYYNLSAEKFTNQVEGGLWYDVPFEYMPFWRNVYNEAQRRKSLT